MKLTDATPAVLVAHLQHARSLIDTPEKWIKGRQAKDAYGRVVVPNDPRACQFCITGAVAVAANRDQLLLSMLNRCLVRSMFPSFTGDIRQDYIARQNDLPDTTHEDVMRYFDQAIAFVQQPKPLSGNRGPIL